MDLTLKIRDIGLANISAPSFSILQGISSRPQAFSRSTLLNISNTSPSFVNLNFKESDGIFRAEYYSFTEFMLKIFLASES